MTWRGVRLKPLQDGAGEAAGGRFAAPAAPYEKVARSPGGGGVFSEGAAAAPSDAAARASDAGRGASPLDGGSGGGDASCAVSGVRAAQRGPPLR
jgi:hypothetical protein